MLALAGKQVASFNPAGHVMDLWASTRSKSMKISPSAVYPILKAAGTPPNLNYSIHYVNLAKRRDRRERIEEQLAQHGMSAYRFEAVCGDTVDDAVIGRQWQCGLNACFDSRQHAFAWHELSSGERGCAGSHAALWEICVSDNRPMLVLEDDALFDDSFSVPVLEQAMRHLAQHDPTLMKLEYSRQTTWGDYCKNITSEGLEIRNVLYNWETGAYVIWPKMAAKLLKLLPMKEPVDNFLARLAYYDDIRMYACYPPLVHQHYGGDNDIYHTGTYGWSSISEMMEHQNQMDMKIPPRRQDLEDW